MSEIQELKKELPGIDCGSCGAPNCRAFAEDVVTTGKNRLGCVLLNNRRLRELLETEDKENDG